MKIKQTVLIMTKICQNSAKKERIKQNQKLKNCFRSLCALFSCYSAAWGHCTLEFILKYRCFHIHCWIYMHNHRNVYTNAHTHTVTHSLTHTRRCSVIRGLAGFAGLCAFPLSWMVSILVCARVCGLKCVFV